MYWSSLIGLSSDARMAGRQFVLASFTWPVFGQLVVIFALRIIWKMIADLILNCSQLLTWNREFFIRKLECVGAKHRRPILFEFQVPMHCTQVQYQCVVSLWCKAYDKKKVWIVCYRCDYPKDGFSKEEGAECPDYKSHDVAPGKYMQRVNGIWLVRDCNLAVAGLVWNQTACRCEWGPDGDLSLLTFDRECRTY
jgi:hypothetical protein